MTKVEIKNGKKIVAAKPGEKDNLGNLGTNGSIILKYIVRK
jgi:hypothetical protein